MRNGTFSRTCIYGGCAVCTPVAEGISGRDQLLVVGVGALAPTVVIQAYKVICELTLIF